MPVDILALIAPLKASVELETSRPGKLRIELIEHLNLKIMIYQTMIDTEKTFESPEELDKAVQIILDEEKKKTRQNKKKTKADDKSKKAAEEEVAAKAAEAEAAAKAAEATEDDEEDEEDEEEVEEDVEEEVEEEEEEDEDDEEIEYLEQDINELRIKLDKLYNIINDDKILATETQWNEYSKISKKLALKCKSYQDYLEKKRKKCSKLKQTIEKLKQKTDELYDKLPDDNIPDTDPRLTLYENSLKQLKKETKHSQKLDERIKNKESEELEQNVKYLKMECDTLVKILNDNKVSDSDSRHSLLVNLVEKFTLASVELEGYKPKVEEPIDMVKAKIKQDILQIEQRNRKYDELLKSYKSLFSQSTYDNYPELNEDEEDYYQKLKESEISRIKNLNILKEKLIDLMEKSELFNKTDLKFKFDADVIILNINKLIKYIELVKKIDDLDIKLEEAGLEVCEEYTIEEYENKLEELKSV